jgi:hypothetical protein
MIKLIDQRAEELKLIEIARQKRSEITTTPAQVDSHTYILVRTRCNTKLSQEEICSAVEAFKKRWQEFQEYDSSHAEPFLSK